MPRHPLPHPSRRAVVLGGALVAVAAGGCDLGSSGSPSPPARSGASGPRSEDPDAALVESVVTELTALVALVTGASRAHRRLADEMAVWQLLHNAHLGALEATGQPGADTPRRRVRGSAAEVRQLVRRREAAAQRQLADWSVAAESGPLASLLATMSAAVAQQLVTPAPRAAG